MKITHVTTRVLSTPADNPLVVGLPAPTDTREFVLLELGTDQGLTGIGLTFFGAALTPALKVAVDTLAPITAVKLGAAGCILCGRRIASPAADVIDPTGAGDAFAAAFCIAIVSGEGPQQAGERAVRVAAAAVAKVGARPA